MAITKIVGRKIGTNMAANRPDKNERSVWFQVSHKTIAAIGMNNPKVISATLR